MDYTRNDYKDDAAYVGDDFERDNAQYDDVDDNCYFRMEDCYDEDGSFDYDSLEDAIMDGEYVPEDW